ncbi:hypothetical protein SBRCBS47491_001847 [Sporothrix bragantina]|uniref:Uncharacterized protein n=1 Tax=Sporothrix bragantina TaxID=671064 RepID=A0ABP0B204_9PEZI
MQLVSQGRPVIIRGLFLHDSVNKARYPGSFEHSCHDCDERHFAPVLQARLDGSTVHYEYDKEDLNFIPPTIFLDERNKPLNQYWCIPVLQMPSRHKYSWREDPQLPPRQAFADALERNVAYLEGMMCGHIAPTDARLMLPFERGQCCCWDIQDRATMPRSLFPLPSTANYRHCHSIVNQDSAGNECCPCFVERYPQWAFEDFCVDMYGEDYMDRDDEEAKYDVNMTWVRPPKVPVMPRNEKRKAIRADLHRDAVNCITRKTHRYRCPCCPAVYSWGFDRDTNVVYFMMARKTRSIVWPDQKEWLQLLDPTWRIGEATDLKTHYSTSCSDQYCKTNTHWLAKMR